MIKFADYEKTGNRKDIVNYCTNCTAISASYFKVCPDCGTKQNIIKRSIIGYTGNQNELGIPVMVINKSELVNKFIPEYCVKKLTDQDLIMIARIIEVTINENVPDLIHKIGIKYINKLT